MSDSFSRRQLISNVYAPTLLHAAGYGMLSPAIPLYAHQLDISLGLIGLLVAVQGIGAMATDVPAALITARIGGRRAMALGTAASVAGALALGLSESALQLFLAIPLIGIGTAGLGMARLSYVADVAPVEQRGRALAVVGGSSRIGMTLGPILGGLLGEALGLQAVFFGAAAVEAVALLLVATSRGPESSPAPVHAESAHTRLLRTVIDHRRDLATAGGVAVSLAMLRSARRVLVPLWGAWIGLDLAEIGLVIGVASAVDMTLFYPVGAVMDRWGRKWTIVPCLVLLTVSLVWIPLTTTFAAFLLASVVGGFGNGLGSGAIQTMGADLAPLERSGEFLGVWRLIADSGGVLAPAVVGGVAQALTLGSAFFAAASFGVLGALVMVLLVPEGLTHAERGSRQ